MDKQGKESADAEISWNDENGKDAMWKILEFVTESDEAFFRRITEGLTDEEVEEYLQEFPEFRKYWKT